MHMGTRRFRAGPRRFLLRRLRFLLDIGRIDPCRRVVDVGRLNGLGQYTGVALTHRRVGPTHLQSGHASSFVTSVSTCSKMAAS